MASHPFCAAYSTLLLMMRLTFSLPSFNHLSPAHPRSGFPKSTSLNSPLSARQSSYDPALK